MKILSLVLSYLSLIFLPLQAENVEKLIFSWQMDEAKKIIESMETPQYHISGLYKFYSGDYKEAQKYFKQSPVKYTHWLKLVEKIIPITENFEEIKSDYFVIRCTGKDKISGIYLKEILDIAAKNLFRKFNWKPEDKVILEIYPDRESFQIASTLTDKQIKVSGAIGICKFNRLMMASPRILKFGYSWADTATHEYVHYIIGRITGLKNVPLWFNEGLAKYFEVIWRKDKNELEPIDINFLIKAKNTGQWVEFEKMKRGMPTLDTKDEVILAYAQVQSMIDYLNINYGWNKIKEVVYKLKNNSAEKSFKEVYGKSISELRMEWEKYIKNTELKITPGASGPSYAFNEDPGNALSEWVSEIALTDIRIANRFKAIGKYELAIRKYSQALKKDKGNAVILNMLARVQMITGESEKAKKNFLLAVKSNTSYAPPYLHIGKLLIDEGNFTEAEKYIMNYIYISPFNPESHKLLLNIYEKTGFKHKAERETRILNILDEKE